jgi:hypothetical protein
MINARSPSNSINPAMVKDRNAMRMSINKNIDPVIQKLRCTFISKIFPGEWFNADN